MGLGITVLIDAASRQEIDRGSLSVIKLSGFSEQREFNFVLLKNSFFRERYMEIFRLLKENFDG